MLVESRQLHSVDNYKIRRVPLAMNGGESM